MWNSTGLLSKVTELFRIYDIAVFSTGGCCSKFHTEPARGFTLNKYMCIPLYISVFSTVLIIFVTLQWEHHMTVLPFFHLITSTSVTCLMEHNLCVSNLHLQALHTHQHMIYDNFKVQFFMFISQFHHTVTCGCERDTYIIMCVWGTLKCIPYKFMCHVETGWCMCLSGGT